MNRSLQQYYMTSQGAWIGLDFTPLVADKTALPVIVSQGTGGEPELKAKGIPDENIWMIIAPEQRGIFVTAVKVAEVMASTPPGTPIQINPATGEVSELYNMPGSEEIDPEDDTNLN